MKQVELNKKHNSNYLNIFSINEKYFLVIGAIISILWLTLLTKYNFGKGIDFSDTTLTYHFSLRILRGDVPFRDFHSMVMPLAFYVEAFFHKIFGLNFIVNSYLALITIFFQTIFIFLIIKKFFKENIYALLSAFFVIGFLGNIHQAIHFSFTHLATAFSLASIYFGLSSFENKKYIILFGFFSGLTFLTKQNFGIAIFLGFIFYLILNLIFFKYEIKKATRQLLQYLLGISVVIVPFFTYFYLIGSSSELIYILTSGPERKGLASLFDLQTLNSLISILEPKVIIPSIIFALWTIYTYIFKKRNLLLYTFIGLGLFGVASIYLQGKFMTVNNLLTYDSPKILMPCIILYFCIFKKNIDKKFFFYLIIASSLIFLNELSWPGRGPDFKHLTGIFIFIMPSLLFNGSLGEEKNYTYRLVKLVMLISNVILGIFAFIIPKENLYRDFNSNATINLNPFLNNRKVSPEHKSLILSANKITKDNCENQSVFIFPWAPILYDFTGSRNVTRFDLPYHDWLTEKEADEAIDDLRVSPPCMMIIDKSAISLEGRYSPFKAIPMRKIEQFLKEELLKQYTLIDSKKSFQDEKLFFLKNQ